MCGLASVTCETHHETEEELAIDVVEEVELFLGYNDVCTWVIGWDEGRHFFFLSLRNVDIADDEEDDTCIYRLEYYMVFWDEIYKTVQFVIFGKHLVRGIDSLTIM